MCSFTNIFDSSYFILLDFKLQKLLFTSVAFSSNTIMYLLEKTIVFTYLLYHELSIYYFKEFLNRDIFIKFNNYFTYMYTNSIKLYFSC